MHKVNLEVIKPWITKKVTELLSLEDDVLINYVFSLLEEKVNQLVVIDVPCSVSRVVIDVLCPS